MHIILTHEQADFDALAALLGAYLLEEHALPILPRRMNRNLNAYLTLYGLDLPFIDPRDVPKGPIKTITLVDTQSMISLKGASKRTQVFIVDHHPPRSDLPDGWTLNYQNTGAATTILVESLQERDIRLTNTQATLLLLGIYEDTGSLIYTRTTARDIRAAAYLMEQGANLTTVREYLNHPLSHAQQAVYEQLQNNLESHTIQSHTVVIAEGDASKTDEEVSTLAHRLRDVLDPDALLLLVITKSGVRLVARATTDRINVGLLAAHFGGGGHPRAAAALIREQSLKEVKAELLAVLPDYIRPPVTVAEIMSRGPQLLDEDTPVKQAAEYMQRYGYEGYPVVAANKKIIGLLTRRAVDRALSHKLNLKAKDIMMAGTAHIHPHQSIDDLQQVMTETGWGQVPVTDPDTHEIIGIVTRTDLLKTLTPETENNHRQNMAGRLESSLPTARLVLLKAVAKMTQQQQDALYIVGGFVRDLLLERGSADVDLVVEGDAIALGHALVARYGGRVSTHKRFGTAKWRIAKIKDRLAAALQIEFDCELDADDFPPSLDLISARREFYTHPTALPTVERGSIKLDLHRRDFTINTLALRLDSHHYGQLHDYWGGQTDLQNKLVRVLHSLSFVDDPTRILRAVRFEQRFGYQLGGRTQELLKAAHPLLDRVSGDRLRHELNTILQEENSEQMLARLNILGTLAAIHPALTWSGETQARLDLARTSAPDSAWAIEAQLDGYSLQLALSYILWLILLPGDSAAQVAERLRIPGWLTKSILAACELGSQLPALDKAPVSQWVAVLDNMPHLAIYARYLVTASQTLRTALHDYMTKWRFIQPAISGHDLRTRGIPPGPEYTRLLDALRNAWLDGLISAPQEELDLLEILLDD